MRKRGIFILFIVIAGLNIYAQQISHEVLVPASSVVSSGDYFISQTIGESVTTLISNESYIFTQGFQQPTAHKLFEIEHTGSGVKVYPNPVMRSLNLELYGDRSIEYHVTIFGFNGAIYFKKDYPCTAPFPFQHKIPIDVSNYQRGTYFVKVVTEDGMISRLFKIEKM